MQVNKIIISIIIITGMFSTSCDDLMDPVNTNPSREERVYEDRNFAEGLIANGYTGWLNGYRLDEVATDDAVSNVRGNTYTRMATGEWSASFNPVSVWGDTYRRIYYLNYYLSIKNDILYAWDNRISPSELRTEYYKQRFTGETKLLRAWYNFQLLQSHGGIATDNTPKGAVILNTIIDDLDDSYDIPRGSYNEHVQFILDDINEGLSLLPFEYEDRPGEIAYNTVFGNRDDEKAGRINGKFAKALKSRVFLYVASMPFYNVTDKWERAAVAAAELLSSNYEGGINGVAGMASDGIYFWQHEHSPEILFRRAFFNSNAREQANFPPSRFGRGETNPSQNLVDAFPMANGYPIDHPSSGYDPTNPYEGRDLRLSAYIIYDGNDLNNDVIHTNLQDDSDGLNMMETSSRTGYYLKKLLQPAVNLDPRVMSTRRNFYTLFRYTEIFLNYAEAANEAWGPDADPMGYGFTPRTIIRAIRDRAGIPDNDPYLVSINTQGEMRDMIRNERRLELCFEGFRFWDMRRWGIDLDEPIRGIAIDNDIYSVITVEQRNYQPHMRYGPIPFDEVLKSNMILQNAEW